MFIFPVGHGCIGFGSYQESEFKRMFVDEFFTLRTLVEFVFSVVVYDSDYAGKSIGKRTYFNQDLPWRYLNNGPIQGKNELGQRFHCEKLIQKLPFKLGFLMKPKTSTAMANRKKWTSSFCFVFLIFCRELHLKRFGMYQRTGRTDREFYKNGTPMWLNCYPNGT